MGGDAIVQIVSYDGKRETWKTESRFVEDMYAASLKSPDALGEAFKEHWKRSDYFTLDDGLYKVTDSLFEDGYAHWKPEEMLTHIYYKVTFYKDEDGTVVSMSMPEEAILQDGKAKMVPARMCFQARQRALDKRGAAKAMKKQKCRNVRSMLNRILEQVNGDYINTREVYKAVMGANKCVKSIMSDE
tara:strand:+ start:306 stop:866 length:561 start_codon:yes stop_codon:yes gene_type:complete